MSQTLIIDGDVTILKIFPSESELCDIRTNIPCPVNGCSNIFKSSSNLTMHLEKYHRLTQPNQSSLEKKSDKIIYQYYCPAEFCRYHVDLKLNKKKLFFPQLKYLKQHFLKVHSEKRFVCASCNKSFSIESALKRHQLECGLEYKCSCGQAYSSRHNLRVHAMRKNHAFDDTDKRLKAYPVPVSKTPSVQIPSKPVIAKHSAFETVVTARSPLLFEPIKLADNKNIVILASNKLKEKHISSIHKKRTELSSLVKKKIVLKKFENARKMMKRTKTCFSDLKQEKISDVSNVANCMSMKDENLRSDPNFGPTTEIVRTQADSITSSWTKSDAKLGLNEPMTGFSCTDINLNELNSCIKTDAQPRNIFDNFEFSNSPKLSQSTQTNAPFLSSLTSAQTDCDVTFDDSNLCYYDSFEFSNSPKLSQSTQTFQSSSQISQTDIQSSFFDDSSNNLSEFVGYYDNFETSNSPKLSQSTQTIGHSLCSWSDNVTQTDLDDELFGDSSIAQLDECYHVEPSYSNDCKSRSSCDSVNNNFSTKAEGMDKVSDESVSTQTAWSAVFQDDRHGSSRSLLDALTTSETQTDSSESSFLCSRVQSFNSAQTQTSTSFNYLIDSETQTQELLNRLIDIQTQTYVSNSICN